METLNCLLRGQGRVVICLVSRWMVEMEKEWRFFICCLLIIFWCVATQVEMAYLCWLLLWFEAILGLKINPSKTELTLVGWVANLEDLGFELGWKVGDFWLLTSVFLKVPLLIPWCFGMEWKRGSEKDWQCGKDCIFPKGGDLLWSRALYLASYLFYVIILDVEESEFEIWTNSEGFPMGWLEFKEKVSFSEVDYYMFK